MHRDLGGFRRAKAVGFSGDRWGTDPGTTARTETRTLSQVVPKTLADSHHDTGLAQAASKPIRTMVRGELPSGQGMCSNGRAAVTARGAAVRQSPPVTPKATRGCHEEQGQPNHEFPRGVTTASGGLPSRACYRRPVRRKQSPGPLGPTGRTTRCRYRSTRISSTSGS